MLTDLKKILSKQTEQKNWNKAVVKGPATPKVRRYITL